MMRWHAKYAIFMEQESARPVQSVRRAAQHAVAHSAWVNRLCTGAGSAYICVRLLGEQAPSHWTLAQLFPYANDMRMLLQCIISGAAQEGADDTVCAEFVAAHANVAPDARRHQPSVHAAAAAAVARVLSRGVAHARAQTAPQLAAAIAAQPRASAHTAAEAVPLACEMLRAQLAWLRDGAVRWALAIDAFLRAYPFDTLHYETGAGAAVPLRLARAEPRLARALPSEAAVERDGRVAAPDSDVAVRRELARVWAAAQTRCAHARAPAAQLAEHVGAAAERIEEFAHALWRRYDALATCLASEAVAYETARRILATRFVADDEAPPSTAAALAARLVELSEAPLPRHAAERAVAWLHGAAARRPDAQLLRVRERERERAPDASGGTALQHSTAVLARETALLRARAEIERLRAEVARLTAGAGAGARPHKRVRFADVAREPAAPDPADDARARERAAPVLDLVDVYDDDYG